MSSASMLISMSPSLAFISFLFYCNSFLGLFCECAFRNKPQPCHVQSILALGSTVYMQMSFFGTWRLTHMRSSLFSVLFRLSLHHPPSFSPLLSLYYLIRCYLFRSKISRQTNKQVPGTRSLPLSSLPLPPSLPPLQLVLLPLMYTSWLLVACRGNRRRRLQGGREGEGREGGRAHVRWIRPDRCAFVLILFMCATYFAAAG